MSTRSQIAFYEKADRPISCADIFVSKHYDGDPDGVLPFLVPFCQSFSRYRGLDDLSYATARCIAALCDEYYKERQRWIALRQAAGEDTYLYEELDFLGVGVAAALQSDIAYFHHVSPTEIKVYACDRDQPPADWTLVRTIPLE